MAAVRKLIHEARFPKEKGQPLSQDGWPFLFFRTQDLLK
jgi:hypothetical protein